MTRRPTTAYSYSAWFHWNGSSGGSDGRKFILETTGIGKIGSRHIFWHAMVTLMLENGADLRYVRQMLGHARLNTTEIDTHVNIQKLIEVHRLTRPTKVPQAEAKLEKDPAGR